MGFDVAWVSANLGQFKQKALENAPPCNAAGIGRKKNACSRSPGYRIAGLTDIKAADTPISSRLSSMDSSAILIKPFKESL